MIIVGFVVLAAAVVLGAAVIVQNPRHGDCACVQPIRAHRCGNNYSP